MSQPERPSAAKDRAEDEESIGAPMRNVLLCGDNLTLLRRHLADESVDLVYLDPPFQSGKDYSIVFETRSGQHMRERARTRAFSDIWKWGRHVQSSYAEIQRHRGAAARAVAALGSILGKSDVMAYLCMMAIRLLELRRVLKKTGSLYLHCDPTASHYLKVLLDGVFGPACFKNEIIWRYRRWPAKARRFQRMHDVLLFYSASPDSARTFHTLYGYEALASSTLKTFGTKRQRADFSSGHRKPSVETTDTSGPPLSDVWEVGVIAAIGKERTGYPTQKPEALLERVIRASSSEGDLVLDPFCGSGTTLVVAQRLNRSWIGMDLLPRAIEMAQARVQGAQLGLFDRKLAGATRLA